MPVCQPARERVVPGHRRARACCGLGDAHPHGEAVEPDLRVQRVRVVGVGGDRLGHQLLHRDERVAGLGGLAPVGIRRRVSATLLSWQGGEIYSLGGCRVCGC